jgi:hypothetical protein
MFHIGERVRIVGFDSLPKSLLNHAVAIVKAYNHNNNKLVVQLPSADFLVLLSDRHVDRIDGMNETVGTMRELLINKEDTCAICLAGLKSSCRIQTHCSHVFHETCLHQWIRKNNGFASCPLCRINLNANKPHAIRIETIDKVCEKYSLCLRSV